jgi:hypothetical protein
MDQHGRIPRGKNESIVSVIRQWLRSAISRSATKPKKPVAVRIGYLNHAAPAISATRTSEQHFPKSQDNATPAARREQQ